MNKDLLKLIAEWEIIRLHWHKRAEDPEDTNVDNRRIHEIRAISYDKCITDLKAILKQHNIK